MCLHACSTSCKLCSTVLWNQVAVWYNMVLKVEPVTTKLTWFCYLQTTHLPVSLQQMHSHPKGRKNLDTVSWNFHALSTYGWQNEKEAVVRYQDGWYQ